MDAGYGEFVKPRGSAPSSSRWSSRRDPADRTEELERVAADIARDMAERAERKHAERAERKQSLPPDSEVWPPESDAWPPESEPAYTDAYGYVSDATVHDTYSAQGDADDSQSAAGSEAGSYKSRASKASRYSRRSVAASEYQPSESGQSDAPQVDLQSDVSNQNGRW